MMWQRTRSAIFEPAVVVLMVVAAAGTTIVAHDLWIEPTTFSPAPGQIVGVRLRLGQDLVGDPVPRDPALVNQFVIEDGVARKPVVGRFGAEPAGLVRVATPGVHVIGYASRPTAIDVAAGKFNQYLKEEGLDAIAVLRTRRQQGDSSARELFSRCAKSLILTGSADASSGGDRVLGFTLELLAERNPYALRAGDELPVRLTYEGRPLPGALVVAMNRQNPADKLTARTGADGRVRFRLPRTGMWLIKSVHMVPAPAGTDADWTSFWASLTFELRPTPAAGR